MITKSITLIGAGNVGFHLAKRFFECGHKIQQIYSRTLSRAADIAALTKAEPIDDFKKLTPLSDVYILAVRDDGIAAVVNAIAPYIPPHATIVHTSGAVPSTVFAQHFNHYGVFYPLQTFSRHKEISFHALPLCICGNTPDLTEDLSVLARTICPNIYTLDDQQRGILHLGAVFVNNFSNYLCGVAYDLCQDNQVPFDILKPLVAETFEKVLGHVPKSVQTGPAVRGDQKTMERHLSLLNQTPQYQALYQQLSEGIQLWFQSQKADSTIL